MPDLELQIYGEIADLALLLARRHVFHDDLGSRCDICSFSWSMTIPPRHADSCIVGAIVRLIARLGELRDRASVARAMDGGQPVDRYIEYDPSRPAGSDALLNPLALIPGNRVTHEEAAFAAAEGRR
jgi:hypothetical protein